MSTCHYQLNLPKKPLRPGIKFTDFKHCADRRFPGSSHQYNLIPKMVLSEELLHLLDEHGVKDSVITVFSLHSRPLSQALLHSDILLVNNEWKSASYGINWELNGHCPIFSWWETRRSPAYPTRENYFKMYPQGIHYGLRGQTGIEPEDIQLDQAILSDTALLVRTDVPHTVHFSDRKEKLRLAMSLRFLDSTDITWQQSVEKFSTLII